MPLRDVVIKIPFSLDTRIGSENKLEVNPSADIPII